MPVSKHSVVEISSSPINLLLKSVHKGTRHYQFYDCYWVVTFLNKLCLL